MSSYDLASVFQSISLSETQQPSQHSDFVGGFHPGILSNTSSASHGTFQMARPGYPPTSDTRPRPQVRPKHYSHQGESMSLTMKMALQQLPWSSTSSFPTPSARPSRSSVLSDNRPISDSISAIQPSTGSPMLPDGRPRSASTTSQSSKTTAQQCAGMTKAGKRCTRQVRLGPALSKAYDNTQLDGEEPLERYCFQHVKELLTSSSGFYSRKDGSWINFAGNRSPHCLQR